LEIVRPRIIYEERVLASHVLIVDDDLTIRNVLCVIFKRAGYEVTEAISGLEALQKIRQQHIDLITMDMAMSDMDGIDTISIIRNEAPIPIVVISAFLTAKVQQDLDNRGIVHRLIKPFTAEQVLTTAQRALDAASQS